MENTAKVIDGEFILDMGNLGAKVPLRVKNDVRRPETRITMEYLEKYFDQKMKNLGFNKKYIGQRYIRDMCVHLFKEYITTNNLLSIWNIPMKIVFVDVVADYRKRYGDNAPNYNQIEAACRTVIQRTYERQPIHHQRLCNPEWAELFSIDRPTIKETLFSITEKAIEELL